MVYKVAYLLRGRPMEFAGFTIDGGAFSAFCNGFRTTKHYARRIKKMLECQPKYKDVHIVKCSTDGEENKKCLAFVDFENQLIVPK